MLKKTISGQIDKLTEQNKIIIKLQSIKINQLKKIDDLKNMISGLLDAFYLYICFINVLFFFQLTQIVAKTLKIPTRVHQLELTRLILTGKLSRFGVKLTVLLIEGP